MNKKPIDFLYDYKTLDLYDLEQEKKRCKDIDFFTGGKHPNYKLRIKALDILIKEKKEKE